MSKFFTAGRRLPIAVGWFLLSLLVGCANDVISKFLGNSLHPVEISFFRFFFSGVTLLPLMVVYGLRAFHTPRFSIHLGRGLLLFCSITLWTIGLTSVPIAAATLINFSIPLFVLILSNLFLQENIGWQRWIATVLGFIGISIVVGPADSDAFNYMTLVLVIASCMFAGLDVMNKYHVSNESMLSMLFYSAIVTTVLSAVPTLFVWTMPTLSEILLCMVLGLGANLILFCLLKAFALSDASALVPFRYVEFLLAALFGYLIFEELPSHSAYYGALVIIPTTLFIVYYEIRNESMRHL